MGFIIEDEDIGFDLEIRRESIKFFPKEGDAFFYPSDYFPPGVVEISKDYLKKLLDYFSQEGKREGHGV